jgi:hypothetical protein
MAWIVCKCCGGTPVPCCLQRGCPTKQDKPPVVGGTKVTYLVLYSGSTWRSGSSTASSLASTGGIGIAG